MEIYMYILICVLIFIFSFVLGAIILIKYGYVKCNSHVCLVGKTALVTGGSSGLGYQIVLSLASRGCKVIIVDKIVNEDIRNSIVEETDNRNILMEYADFASFQSVRQFCEKLKAKESKLDILVNNAGIVKCADALTEDGLNKVMQINHYSSFLLTHLLLDLLKKSKDARIIFTSSISAFIHNYKLDSVTDTSIKECSNRNSDYMNSKFLNIVTSDIFAKKLKKYNITSNVYHPGLAKTKITEPVKIYRKTFVDWFAWIFTWVFQFILENDANIAAQPAINLIVSKEFKNTTGLFYGKYFPNLKPKLANNEEFCQRLWKASEYIVQLKTNEII